eukprot:6188678-Pleurochrysis_carterae.AAC.3
MQHDFRQISRVLIPLGRSTRRTARSARTASERTHATPRTARHARLARPAGQRTFTRHGRSRLEARAVACSARPTWASSRDTLMAAWRTSRKATVSLNHLGLDPVQLELLCGKDTQLSQNPSRVVRFTAERDASRRCSEHVQSKSSSISFTATSRDHPDKARMDSKLGPILSSHHTPPLQSKDDKLLRGQLNMFPPPNDGSHTPYSRLSDALVETNFNKSAGASSTYAFDRLHSYNARRLYGSGASFAELKLTAMAAKTLSAEANLRMRACELLDWEWT